MKDKTSIVLTGVGGQGVITASNIFGKAAVKAKVNVFVSETHGMAQRGGSVICSVRLGNVTGPLVPSGTADAIISLEPVETLRYVGLTNKETTQLLVDCFTALSERKNKQSIHCILDAIKKGNPKNRYALAGMLLRAVE